jgi:hypothetical protein
MACRLVDVRDVMWVLLLAAGLADQLDDLWVVRLEILLVVLTA